MLRDERIRTMKSGLWGSIHAAIGLLASVLGTMLPAATGWAGQIVYEYDDAGRLVTVAGTDGYTTIYVLDDAGNRKTVTTSIVPLSTPPTVPGNLAASASSATQVDLSWSPSRASAPATIAGYKIFRDGAQMGTSTVAGYSDATTTGSTAYSYRVSAYDSGGFSSSQSAVASITTPPVQAAPNAPVSVPTPAAQWIRLTDTSFSVLPAHAGTYACSAITYTNGDYNAECHLVSSGVPVYRYYVFYPDWDGYVAPGYRNLNGALEVESSRYGQNP